MAGTVMERRCASCAHVACAPTTDAVAAANLIVITFDKKRKQDQAALAPTLLRMTIPCMHLLIFHPCRKQSDSEDRRNQANKRPWQHMPIGHATASYLSLNL